MGEARVAGTPIPGPGARPADARLLSAQMLDPRIYRTGLVVVVLAVFVLAFSLDDQQGALGTTLAPDAFNGQNVVSTMTTLANQYPVRQPGSAYDDALATYVAMQLRGDGFAVSTNTFKAQTIDGPRTLENVVGTRAGSVDGSIVVVSHRDALGSPASAELSGTAVLLELARVLSGETQNRSVVLVSTSGSQGSAGTAELARTLPGPIDAVIVLGDLAGAHVREPIVVPWSGGTQVAPTMLRNTIGAAVSDQALLRPGGTSLAGQLAHLAFPLSISEQAPFGLHGEPAVLLSVSGERGPSSGEPLNTSTMASLGRAVLVSIGALDSGPAIPSPSAYVLFAGKVIPGWAISVFVLALLVPVVMSAIDGLARARRRGHAILPWVVWVLSAGLAFTVGVLVVLACRLAGLIAVAPPGAVGAAVVPLHGSGIVAIALTGCAILVSFVVLRRLLVLLVGGEPRTRHRIGELPSAGAGAGVLAVLCALAFAMWLSNPFAAALIVIALHFWMWIVDVELRLRSAIVIPLLLAGIAAPVLVLLYYALTFGLTPVDVIWNGMLLIAGGQLGLVAAVEWSIALGCLISVVTIAVQIARAGRPAAAPITVRGPVGYAGPGSLGGTESALRRSR